MPVRNAKWNGNFRNFQVSRKKDNLERWTEIFETNFRKLSVSFNFEPDFLEILIQWNSPLISPIGFRHGRFKNSRAPSLQTTDFPSAFFLLFRQDVDQFPCRTEDGSSRFYFSNILLLRCDAR